MHMLGQAILLFTLNLLDAILTIYWVRNGVAEEGNQLMAGLLEMGNTPFLFVKIAVGTFSAFVLWRFRNYRLAKMGLTFTISIYVLIIGVHFVTGLTAIGLLSDAFFSDFGRWTHSVSAFFI
jgi:Domain of unknown function (DUF5658)